MQWLGMGRTRDLLALLTLWGLIVLRSWVFVTYQQAHFDSDQAVFGIMADDLVEGRAFPMFMYGQTYLLAVSVWLCAPFFALFGPSIVTLKLPMLLMNLGVVSVLWCGLRAERMTRAGTALALLPFAVPSVVVSSRLVEHQGGNIEPFVFLLLAFLLRARPIALGLVLGVAVMNREFVLIGFVALLIMDGIEGQLWVRLRARARSAGVMLLVIAGIRVVAKTFSTSYHGRRAPLGAPTWQNVTGFFEQQLPALLGASRGRLADQNITSSLTVDHPWLYAVFVLWIVAVCVVLLRQKCITRGDLHGLSTYLLLVGGGQAAAFFVLSSNGFEVTLVRYVLVCLLAVVGPISFALRSAALRVVTFATVGLIASCNLWGSLRVLHEYLSGPPQRDLMILADRLLARGVRYGTADYWTSFEVDWLTRERVTLSPPLHNDPRVDRHRKAVDAHRQEAVVISTEPCPDGERELRWYICPPQS